MAILDKTGAPVNNRRRILLEVRIIDQPAYSSTGDVASARYELDDLRSDMVQSFLSQLAHSIYNQLRTSGAILPSSPAMNGPQIRESEPL